MTKRKAIEAAMAAGWGAYTYQAGTSEDCETMADGMDRLANVAAERTYDAGRIAGLRYAASCANEPSDAVKYRQWANMLAKKARAAK